MSRSPLIWKSATLLAAAAVITSCGGSDNGAAPNTSNPTTTVSVATEASVLADPASDDNPSSDSGPTTVETSGDSGAATTRCDAIFTIAEIEELFDEPAELTEKTNDSLGQLVCDWESIEDPNNVDDLAVKILTVQFYSGSPIEASTFFDPSILDSAVTIDGVGDLAYADGQGMSYYFVDDPVGGSLSYTEADLGDIGAPKLRSSDDIEALFRTFHDRVT